MKLVYYLLSRWSFKVTSTSLRITYNLNYGLTKNFGQNKCESEKVKAGKLLKNHPQVTHYLIRVLHEEW